MYRMNKDVIKARKESGLARFERTTKGYKIPGTKEAGRWAQLHSHMDKILRRIRGDKRYANYNLQQNTELEIQPMLEATKALRGGGK